MVMIALKWQVAVASAVSLYDNFNVHCLPSDAFKGSDASSYLSIIISALMICLTPYHNRHSLLMADYIIKLRNDCDLMLTG